MNEIIRESISQGVNITYIPEKKFKTTLISFSMYTPIEKSKVSQRALIPGLLTHSCKKYPNLKDLSIKLEELYGAGVYSSLSKLGDSQVITIYAEGLSNTFATENQNNTNELMSLLCEMIFNPDTDEKKFKEENLNIEKEQLIGDILAEMNDKKSFARKKCQELMCKKERFGVDIKGDIESAKALTGEDVFEAWEELLSQSNIEIMVKGQANIKIITDELKKWFSKIKRNPSLPIENEIIKKAEDVKEVTENMDVTQCKLVMGLRTEIAYPSEDVPAMILANALFGGTTQSKLFLNVREKLSLCYYCSSRFNKHKGIILIESGVEKEKLEDAKKEIIKQLKEIKIGNFTDAELTETKLFISQIIKRTEDSLSSLDSWYVSQSFLKDMDSPQDLIKKIENVSREKVIEAANKISLDTVYVLSSKEKKEEN